jgi:hypothetical protein
MGAEEEEERGLGGVAARALLGIAAAGAAGEDAGDEGRSGQELEVRARSGQDSLQGARARLRAQSEQTAPLVRRRPARGGDAPQARGVDGGNGRNGNRAEQSSPTRQHDRTIARRWRGQKRAE